MNCASTFHLYLSANLTHSSKTFSFSFPKHFLQILTPSLAFEMFPFLSPPQWSYWPKKENQLKLSSSIKSSKIWSEHLVTTFTDHKHVLYCGALWCSGLMSYFVGRGTKGPRIEYAWSQKKQKKTRTLYFLLKKLGSTFFYKTDHCASPPPPHFMCVYLSGKRRSHLKADPVSSKFVGVRQFGESTSKTQLLKYMMGLKILWSFLLQVSII